MGVGSWQLGLYNLCVGRVMICIVAIVWSAIRFDHMHANTLWDISSWVIMELCSCSSLWI